MFDVAKALEKTEVSVSQIRITVLDRRTGEKMIDTIYQFGESFNDRQARLELDRLGYELVNSEIMKTVSGSFSAEGIFRAFAAAEKK